MNKVPGQKNANPSVPWPRVVAMPKTTSTLKPASIPSNLGYPGNTMLEQDKAMVLAVWLALGGSEDELRRREWMGGCWKKESSDDVSEWYGVSVNLGRVTKIFWIELRLSGTVPVEFRVLDALRNLSLEDNYISGVVPTKTLYTTPESSLIKKI